MNDKSKRLPTATHRGLLKLGNLEMEVYQLDDGTRIITLDSMEKFINGLHDGSLVFSEKDVETLAKFIHGKMNLGEISAEEHQV